MGRFRHERRPLDAVQVQAPEAALLVVLVDVVARLVPVAQLDRRIGVVGEALGQRGADGVVGAGVEHEAVAAGRLGRELQAGVVEAGCDVDEVAAVVVGVDDGAAAGEEELRVEVQAGLPGIGPQADAAACRDAEVDDDEVLLMDDVAGEVVERRLGAEGQRGEGEGDDGLGHDVSVCLAGEDQGASAGGLARLGVWAEARRWFSPLRTSKAAAKVSILLGLATVSTYHHSPTTRSRFTSISR
mmetsp:Transcript_65307/g.154253  ORF Transcript_65307/g.154253 Transcript_65307/m.154253 type:complete len:243 (+) Transcript_65307:748-1476(+)